VLGLRGLTTFTLKGKAMNIGSLIGKVSHTFKTTNDHEESATITINFDFASCTDADIKAWLVSNRAVIMQRPLRALSMNEIKALDKSTISASECGKKVKSKADTFKSGVAALRACGMVKEADEIEKKFLDAQYKILHPEMKDEKAEPVTPEVAPDEVETSENEV
jgi:hypothetical protein